MRYLLVVIILSACGVPGDGDVVENPPTIMIEGCEYIQVRPTYDRAFTHKGNCKNPIHNCK